MLKGLKAEIRLYCNAEVDQDLNKAGKKYRFIGVFKKLPQSRIEELIAAMALDSDVEGYMSEEEVLREVLITWEGIKYDDNGTEKDFEYSEKNLDELLEANEYRTALIEQMQTAITTKDFTKRRAAIQQSIEKNL